MFTAQQNEAELGRADVLVVISCFIPSVSGVPINCWDLVPGDQARKKFLTECAQEMNGQGFVLEPLQSEDPFFKASVECLEEARNLFQPIPLRRS